MLLSNISATPLSEGLTFTPPHLHNCLIYFHPPRPAGRISASFRNIPAFRRNIPVSSGNLPASPGSESLTRRNIPASLRNFPASLRALPALSGNVPAPSGNTPASRRNLPLSSGSRFIGENNLKTSLRGSGKPCAIAATEAPEIRHCEKMNSPLREPFSKQSPQSKKEGD